MFKKLIILIIIEVLVLNFPSFSSDLKKNETINKSFKFADTSGEKKLVIDNLNGSISIVGRKISTIELKADKEIRARSQKDFETCQKEVTLKINEQGNMVEIIVDGPFRTEKGDINYRGYDFHGYEVTCNFEVEVPENTILWLKTINDGDIFVKNTDGRYDVKNINGGIEMNDIGGSGKVYALNGNVKVTFTKNPLEDSSYGSLNGEIRLCFTKNLSADFRVKTFNGEIYSDFEFTSLPAKPFIEKTKNKKKVYKSDKTQGFRIGNGGPEIFIDAFNGDAFILAK
jgi:DUF4097 and DUF4098 domain-containing protein YvlB